MKQWISFFAIFNILAFLMTCSENRSPAQSVRFTIKANTVKGENSGFWKSLGYDFLFKIVHEPEGQYFLDRAQRNSSVVYYRTHFTFSNRADADIRAGGNVCGNVLTIDPGGHFQYDFSRVNKTFREYVKRGMKPIVEFSYYPDGLSARSTEKRNDESFEARHGPPSNWGLWKELLNTFMKNLIHEFGKEELRTWYFDVWNEPDSWTQEELPDFFKLYDLFAYTVKSYDPNFRVGGPSCYHLYFMKEFLDHVVHGTNSVTGEKGAPIDFVSYHMYGLSGSWLNSSPEIFPVVSKFTSEMLWWQRLMAEYPELKNVEIHLNEWGLCSHGDSKFVDKYPQLEYRNSEISALFMVKLVDCLYALEDNYNFKTQLLLYWGAWFNSATGPLFMGSRDLMTCGNIPKPILTAYEMLAKLGKDRLAVSGPRSGGRYGLIATKTNNQIQLLAYNFNETDDRFDQIDKIEILLTDLPDGKKVKVEEYWFDRKHHNTYRKWENMGMPKADDQVIQKLKKEAELTPDQAYTVTILNDNVSIKVAMPRHSMCLYVIDD